MDFRVYIPPDGGHVGCGIWQSRSLVWNLGNMDTRTALRRRVRRVSVKIELVSQPVISNRFRYQILYRSFERLTKCISNLEYALSVTVYRRIFHDVTLPRQRKNWSIMITQGAIAGDHFYYKRKRNIVLQLE